MTAIELVKQWQTQEHPKYPAPEFNIGDVVKRIDADESESPMVIVGMRLRYYSSTRRHTWYYELGDHVSIPMVTNDWMDADDLIKVEAKTDDEKWHTTGGDLPIVAVCECWQCNRVRVDDTFDCPHCGAESTPF